MPIKVSIETAASEAAQEAAIVAAEKAKKDKRRAQKRESYRRLSEEKKRAHRARTSEGNKRRRQNKSEEALAEFRKRDRLRKKAAYDANKKGTKLSPGAQSLKSPPAARAEEKEDFSPLTVPERLKSSRCTEVDFVKFYHMSPSKRRKEVNLGTGAKSCESCYRCEYCGTAFWDHEQCRYHENYIHGRGRWRMSELKQAILSAKVAGKHISAMHLQAIYEKNRYTGKSHTL
mmetsp:Transcript_43506/g.92495  ORF Transcript_43506/g.92495 Transcript_43506/m.92495 type:complete len:231 (-) Transcript_43506:79-771(-)